MVVKGKLPHVTQAQTITSTSRPCGMTRPSLPSSHIPSLEPVASLRRLTADTAIYRNHRTKRAGMMCSGCESCHALGDPGNGMAITRLGCLILLLPAHGLPRPPQVNSARARTRSTAIEPRDSKGTPSVRARRWRRGLFQNPGVTVHDLFLDCSSQSRLLSKSSHARRALPAKQP